MIAGCSRKGNNQLPIAIKPAYKKFTLHFSAAGLGSNFGEMEPVFHVSGVKYIYTYQQNSFYQNEARKHPDTICNGNLKESAIDSIIELVAPIKEPKIYKTNAGVMSGDIEYLQITADNINLEFTLHNAFDSTAAKIVSILNHYIPEDKPKLWVSNYSEK